MMKNIFLILIISMVFCLSLVCAGEQDDERLLFENQKNSEKQIASQHQVKKIIRVELDTNKPKKKKILPNKSQRASKKNTFLGRLIYLGDEVLEIKHGKKEISLFLQDSTKYLSKEGNETGKEALEICQIVKAYFNRKTSGAGQAGKNLIDKIIILEPGNCYR